MNKAMKNSIREVMKRTRDMISPSLRKKLSERIHEWLYADKDWRVSRIVMIYCSCRSEVLTTPLIERALGEKKQVIVPCMPDKKDEMIGVRITALKELLDQCTYGISQPRKSLCRAFTGTIDLMIVPGIAFDRSGGRVGYGKGYFDRYLRTRNTGIRAGIAFACQISASILTEAHDVGMDKIITEDEVIDVRKK